MRTWLYVFLAVALDGCAALLAGLIPERQLERARGTFLHIAEVDLVPTVIGKGPSRRRRAEAVLTFVLGLAVVAAATFLWREPG